MTNYQLHTVIVSATVSGGAIVIRDMNNGVSITNSIEKVLSHFEQHHEPIGQRRFFYYDSDGILTEAVHDNGRFIRFDHPGKEPEVLHDKH